jgi:hypothetical protein
MTDALSCFMTDLMSPSPNRGSTTITIISDNAKQCPLPSKDRRRGAPRRSISSPMHHMSRWEALSALGPRDRKSSSVETSPIRITNNRLSRWESSAPSKSSSSTGLKRPTRQAYEEVDKYGAKNPDFMRRNTDMARMSATSLPISLRKLPY